MAAVATMTAVAKFTNSLSTPLPSIIDDTLQAERTQSALFFVQSLQQHVSKSEPLSTISSSSEPLFPSQTTSSSISRSTIRPPNLIIDVHHSQPPSSSLSLSAMGTTTAAKATSTNTAYSAHRSACPYEWDGKPASGHARIWRLNPGPAEVRREGSFVRHEVGFEMIEA